jgi:hypothetical protein
MTIDRTATPRGQRLRTLLKLGFSVLALAALGYMVDFHATLAAMQAVSAPIVLAAVTALSFTVPLIATRWRYVLQALGYDVSLRTLIQSTYSGFLLNQLLPTAVGGDIYRIHILRRLDVPMMQAASSVIVDRVLGLFAAILILLAGLAAARLSGSSSPALAGQIAGMAAISALGLLMLRFIPNLENASVERLLVPVRTLSRDLGDTLAAGPTSSRIILASLLAQIMPVLCLYLLILGAGVSVTFALTLVIGPLAIIAAAIPLTFAGWGLREGALVYSLHQLGVDPTDALAIALLFGLSTTLASLPGLLTLMARISPPDRV